MANGRNGIRISILRQHKLPHELADPPLHPDILGLLFVFFPLPLAADQKHIVILHLDLDVSGLESRHVDDEDIGIGALLHVGRSGRHGLGVADVGPGRGVEGLLGLLGEVREVVQCGQQWGLQTHDSEIHSSLRGWWNFLI